MPDDRYFYVSMGVRVPRRCAECLLPLKDHTAPAVERCKVARAERLGFRPWARGVLAALGESVPS